MNNKTYSFRNLTLSTNGAETLQATERTNGEETLQAKERTAIPGVRTSKHF